MTTSDSTKPELESLAIDYTAYFTRQPPEVRSPELPALLIALHGWGQNAKSFQRHFTPLRHRNVLVVCPQALHQFYLDVETRKVGFSWLTIYERQQAIADANNYLRRLMDHLQRTDHYDPRRVVLFGFSQGSSVAYRFAVSNMLRPAGVISCCSDLPIDVAEKLVNANQFPVLLAYGERDRLVERAKQAEARDALSRAGFSYEDFPYDADHEITPALIEKIGDWVEERGRQHPVQPC